MYSMGNELVPPAVDLSNAQNAPEIHFRKASGPAGPLALFDSHWLASMQCPDPTRTAVSIAVDPVALINTECITVTSAMRKHARWAHSSVSAILGGGLSSSYRQGPRHSGTTEKAKGLRRPSSGMRETGNLAVNDDDDDGSAGRWGLRGKRGRSMQDNPLMSAFARLRSDLRGCIDIRSFDIPSLLHPFLQVIRSSSTSAPITSLALVAITKFFAYNLISKDSPRLSLGMQLLSAAITHCRFEASDSAADEIVLLRILKLMEGMLSGPGGDLLADESICEMMETGLSMCCQMRLSELLRRSAEITLITMCQIVFERLKHLENQIEGDITALGFSAYDADKSELKMDPPLKGKNAASPQLSVENTPSSSGFETSDKASQNGVESRPLTSSAPAPEAKEAPMQPKINGSAIDLSHASVSVLDEEPEIKPYSLPSIRELFRVLVDLLEPHDRQHTDAMRVMALRIIDVALEVAGPSIAKHPSLACLARDDLCRHLFQLVRSDNMNLLNESLRVTGTLLATCRGILKLQQELFLSYLVACLHPRVEIPREAGITPALYEGVPNIPKLVKQPPSQTSSGRSTPVPVKDRQKLGMEGGSRKPDAREAMVESIGALVRMPSFLAELYVNYDCEEDRSDLCEDLVGLLSRNAFPDSATWSTTNVPPLCLDALLGYVQFLADRLDERSLVDGYPDREKLREQRNRKKLIIKGTTKFNENPKAGIAYLVSEGIIKNPDDPKSVAQFLKGTTRISKKVLGEYISKRSHEHLLGAFIDLFDFTDKRVDEALRELLGSFRLPGESPLIERIVTVFSEKYCANSTPEGIADKDAVYVLTYAIIMLNTDQHNPNVKTMNRMAFNDFARNLRGVNGGKDFTPEYLQEIYDSIKTNEIILPDEHDNKHAFDYAWKEMLVKTLSSGDLVICNTNLFDADMFEATWKPVVATLSYVFMSASEDAVYQRVVAGFDQCARIAAEYGLTDVLDHIIYCLSTISTLASDTPTNTALNTEVQVDGKSVMVSELAVKFGRDYRAQLATVVLFKGVVAGNEARIRYGWKYIIRIWLNLFLNSLVPPPTSLVPLTSLQSRRIRDGETEVGKGEMEMKDQDLELPPIPVQFPSQVITRGERSTESGLFQTFTSYLSSYAADDPPEPSDEELNDTLCTIDCLLACPLEDIFTNLTHLPPGSLTTLVHQLLDTLPQKSSPVVIVVKADPPSSPTFSKPNGHRPTSGTLTYDPTVIYVLELATNLATQDFVSISAVAKALQNILRDAGNNHRTVVSRSVFYLLRLLNASQVNEDLSGDSSESSPERSFIRAPVILHTISSLSPPILELSALEIMKGLTLCMRQPSPLRNEIANTPDFWSTIGGLHALQEAASLVFDLLVDIVKGTSSEDGVEKKVSAVTAHNYEAVVALLKDFATAASVGAVFEQKRDKNQRRLKPIKQTESPENHTVSRGSKAIVMIYQLSSRVPSLIQQSHLERNEAWNAYWSPIFLALSTQCVNPCREIRQKSFSGLQRALLSPELASVDHEEWTAIFSEVLFPLISQLLKPEVYHSDPYGMGETRVQATTLLCKIFLHYLVLLSEWDGMLDLWLRILDIMDRMVNSGQGNSLEEAVPESLKNIILVMADGGYLVPPSKNPDQAQIWNETWKRIDRFLPGLFRETFPEQVNPPPAAKEAPRAEEPTGSIDPVKSTLD